MADYDSILKEEKKYEEEPPKPKKFPWFKIDLLCIILVLIIGYVFYFNNILNPKQIFFDDLEEITTQYQSLFTPLLLQELSTNNNLEGTIKINETTYNYNINKNDTNFGLSLSKDDEYIIFSQLQDTSYLKVSNFKEEYLKRNNINNYSKIINNLKKNLTTYLTENKFIKRSDLYNPTPLVISELTLTNEDLKQLTGLTTIKDSYEVLLTIKNHAITNNIISIKAIIKNKTTNKRIVITYDNETLNYKDDDNNLHFKLSKTNDKDFELRILKDDTLYSVLKGTTKEKSYQYSYKIIDEIYSIDLEVKKEKEIITYDINSIIEKNDEKTDNKLTINVNTSPKSIEETINIDKSIDYNKLTEEEKKQYQTLLDNFLLELKNLFTKDK